MRPIQVTVGPVGTVSANGIALSQTPAGAGNLVLNGAFVTNGVANFPSPQRVLITTTDTTHVFTITGNTPTGSVVSETLQNSGTSVQSALDYSSVTSISINGAATAAVTAGNSGVASTPWVRLDEFANAATSIACVVSGTVSYTVQSSNDDPNILSNPVSPQNVTFITTNDANAVNATTSLMTNFLISPLWVRVLLNSGAGSVTATVVQTGSAPY